MLLKIPIIGELFTQSIHVCRTHLYDTFDRLHFLVTAYALAFFVLLIGAKQHYGNPIDCMLPKEVDDVSTWKNYIQTYCLIHGTYRYTFNATSVDLPGHSVEATVPYYQWVPFFFAFQIFCFIFPHWAWTWMQKLLYLDMALVVAITKDLLNEKKPDEHKSKLAKTISYTYDHFKYRRLHKIGYLFFIFLHPAFACFLYIITKLMFLVNVILQLKFVSTFLGFDSWIWGFQMIFTTFAPRADPGYIQGVQGKEVPAYLDTRPNYSETIAFQEFNHFKNFPILVACDYHTMPTLVSIVKNTAQCIIPLNIVNEKIFVGLWLWFVVLTCLTIIGIVRWIVRLTDKRGYEKMIYNLLNFTNRSKFVNTSTSRNQPDHRYHFVHKFLGLDGILLIYFMQDKCGVIQTHEVIDGLYKRYLADFVKPTRPIIMSKKGEKTDYSMMDFDPPKVDYTGINLRNLTSYEEDELYYRRRDLLD